MRYEKIYLEDYFKGLPKTEQKTEVTLYIPDISEEINTEVQFPCTVICPGGGYSWTSDREAEPCALRLLGNGIATAVVRYSCGGAHYPLQVLQVLAAIAYIRRNSKTLHINPDKIAVMGFSAGGHAACSAGLFWQEEEFEKRGYKFKKSCNRKLQYIDIQNLFCELDKYCREKVPSLKSNRVKIKKKYKEKSDIIKYVYPKKWEEDV